jgi:hypothetical protein
MEQRRADIIDNAETILETGKYQGKKISKKQKEQLNIIIENKKRQQAEQAKVLANNQGQVSEQTPLLS